MLRRTLDQNMIRQEVEASSSKPAAQRYTNAPNVTEINERD